EPGNGKPGPASQAKRITTPPRQQSFKALGKVRRHGDRAPRRPRKDPLRYCPRYYIPARRQPQTPSRQPRLDIWHDRAVGADDKADQRIAVAHLANGDAAA